MQSLGSVPSIGSEHTLKRQKIILTFQHPITKEHISAEELANPSAAIEVKPPPILQPAPTAAATTTATTTSNTPASSTESQRTNLDEKPNSSAITITKPKECNGNKSTAVAADVTSAAIPATTAEDNSVSGQTKIDQEMQTDLMSDKNSDQQHASEAVADIAATSVNATNESQSPTCIAASTVDPDDTDADANELDDDEVEDKSLQQEYESMDCTAAAKVEDCADSESTNEAEGKL